MSQINEVTSRLIPLRATAVNGGEIIANATLPPDAVGIPLLSVAVGLLVGLMASVAVAALLSQRDQRIRSASDVNQASELPLLARLRIPRGRSTPQTIKTRSTGCATPSSGTDGTFRPSRSRVPVVTAHRRPLRWG